ncbi:MAG TPA: hypothetical protein VGB24_05495 [Longimicrobium sp.]|uniref:type II toxin-antitoxin system Phd/YefM family antitoxin n=1 Tax=Longimicrobium sp. TaxID=2029185 RepID=UPI002ED9DC33
MSGTSEMCGIFGIAGMFSGFGVDSGSSPGLKAERNMGERAFDIGSESRLLEFIRQAGGGEDVILTNGGEPIAKVIPITRAKGQREFGSAKGLIHMADDFDAPLDDFSDYM